MAIVEMRKLRLVGVAYERDQLLDAMQKSGAVQIIEREDDETSGGVTADEEQRVRVAIEAIEETLRAHKRPVPPALVEVDYTAFSEIDGDRERWTEIVAATEAVRASRQEHAAHATRIKATLAALEPYGALDCTFASVRSTRRFFLTLGTMTQEGVRSFAKIAEERELGVVYGTLTVTQQGLVGVYALCATADTKAVEDALTECGFARCAYDEDVTPAQKAEALRAELAEAESEADRAEQSLLAYGEELQPLKLWADKLKYYAEKARLERSFGTTERTFRLEAYVPKDAEETVAAAVRETSEAVWYEFDDPAEGDKPPTLMRNNPVVEQFEFVTNLYSPPKYREFDPNCVMGIFFLIFFGFIMADIGYGILLSAIGLFMGLRMRKTNGSRSLVLVVGMGGVFALVWGLLFGSLFGVDLGFGVLPNAEKQPETLLVYCLIAGVVQILVGYFLKGIQAIRAGSFWDGLFDGFIWVIFSIGILMVMPELGTSMFGADMGFVPPQWLMLAGLGTAGGSLVVAMLTAGRHVKGFGKFTKGFGAAYGTINFMSDVLSYARLFGLMLSGTIVARIISEMSIQLMNNAIGVIGGVIILVIGHAFNLGIGVLGAYIHDSRLQYIEFYSRFYEGEGELFSPIGSRFNYIRITK